MEQSAQMSRHYREIVFPSASPLVVKLGSSSLTSINTGIQYSKLKRAVNVIAKFHKLGNRVVIVTSGAIASALSPLSFVSRPTDLKTQQALASVGQTLLMNDYAACFRDHDCYVGQVLLSSEDFSRRDHYKNAYGTIGKLLEMNIIPIVNENDTIVTEEIRYGDNDKLAALVSCMISAQAMILLSDVDGVYTTDPSNPDSEFVSEVQRSDDLYNYHIAGTKGKGVGSGGMITKIESALIAGEYGIPTIITNAEYLERVLSGENVGTLFFPSSAQRDARKQWIGYASIPQGKVVVDDGACKALREKNASLLAVGILEVKGTFYPGDPVDIVTADSDVVGRGLISYSSEDVRLMARKTTVQLLEELGEGYSKEVVHRDVLKMWR